jgi:hypothetical protein
VPPPAILPQKKSPAVVKSEDFASQEAFTAFETSHPNQQWDASHRLRNNAIVYLIDPDKGNVQQMLKLQQTRIKVEAYVENVHFLRSHMHLLANGSA